MEVVMWALEGKEGKIEGEATERKKRLRRYREDEGTDFKIELCERILF